MEGNRGSTNRDDKDLLQGKLNGNASVNNNLEADKEETPDKFPGHSATGKTEVNTQNHVAQDTHHDDDDDAEEVDLSCGIWKFRTSIFGKCFANLYLFAICTGIAGLFNYMVMEIVQVQLTSLERQFNIDNARAGLFDTVFKAGYLSTILWVGHFAKKAHIPVLVGLSGVIQGLMLLVPPILQFVDPYELPLITDDRNFTSTGANDKYLCFPTLDNSTDSTNNATATKNVNKVAYIVLLVIHALKGITDVFHAGFLPAIYMDDNSIDKSKVGILIGIQTVFNMLASPLGREINGIISNIPIDLKDTKISSEDHRFVAAWWLGFLIFGSGTALFSIPVMLFPRRMISKRQQKIATDKAVVTFAGGHVEEDVEIIRPGEPQKEITERTIIVKAEPDPTTHSRRPSVRKLSLPHELSDSQRKHSISNISNSSRRASLFPPLKGPTERKVSLTGDIIFDQPIKTAPDSDTPLDKDETFMELMKDLPRALYRVFRRPLFLIMIFDIILESLPAGGTSFFRSTYIANEYNIPMSRVALLTGITSAIGNTCGSILSSWLSSKVTTKAGYALIIFCSYLIAACMTPLYLIFGCDNVPVYGAVGSIGIPVNISGICSCNAEDPLLSCGNDGNNYLTPCHAGCLDVQGNTFTNCSLLANHTGESILSPGLCSTNCDRNFILYVVVFGLQCFVMSSSFINYKLLTLRSVEPQDRAFGISIYIFFWFLLGIPAPNVFGLVVDSACYIKDGDNCVLYNRDTIRYFMSGIDVATYCSAMLTAAMMICYIRWELRKTKRAPQEQGQEDLGARPENRSQVENGTAHRSGKDEIILSSENSRL